MGLGKGVLAAALTASLMMPMPAAHAAGKRSAAKITVHAKKRVWRGYGFLPGYRPTLAEINGLPVLGPDPRRKREWRYFDYHGNVRYGWGGPGFYRGQYNGGSFGPCWTSTPIGMMPTCGQ